MSSLIQDFQAFVNQVVVLDTHGPIVYLGTLTEVTETGFWLEDADVHDCRDGHANKELYVVDARRDGTRANRTRVFVLRTSVTSASRLADVVAD